MKIKANHGGTETRRNTENLRQTSPRNIYTHHLNFSCTLGSGLLGIEALRGADIKIAAVAAAQHAGIGVTAGQRNGIGYISAIFHADNALSSRTRDPDPALFIK